MGFQDTFYDGQAQTRAGDIPGSFIFYPVKPLKDPMLILRADPHAGILYPDMQIIVD